MHDLPLLINIAVALAVAFVGGMLARRLGLPSIVGYLVAGIAIGPFTPGFIGDIATISQLAELGVVFLMFGVGMHFSLRDLWAVRDISLPGAVVQTAIATALGVGLTQLWGWSLPASLVLGLAISVASTVVLLRSLMDNGLLNTPHGRVAIGWLVMEDLATVLILVLLPALAPTTQGNVFGATGLAVLKAAVFTALMLLIGPRLVPWLLMRVARTRSRELFIVSIVAVSLGTAVGSAKLFGVSLALGAFLAGVVLSEDRISHQVEAEIVPFRETFAVLFFVSVGMLVNPVSLGQNAGQVLALTLLIVFGKAVIAAVFCFLLPHPVRTGLVVGAGLSQIGEFSFIVGQAGLALGILSQEQYSLILAGALVSIVVNPFMFRAIAPLERLLQRSPALWQRLNRHGPPPRPLNEGLSGHVVLIGHGRVGQHVTAVLQRLNIPYVVVDRDAERIEAMDKDGLPALFGDAANSEILSYAGLERASVLVVTVPDEATTEIVVGAARQLAPPLPLVVRAGTVDGVNRLSQLGANDVIHPELEGGLEIVRHTLLRLNFPLLEVQRYTDAVRQDKYEAMPTTPEERRSLEQLVNATRGIQVNWLTVGAASSVAGQSLAEADLRARTGASVIAIRRDGQIVANPKSATVFRPGDRVGLLGEPAQLAEVERVLEPPS